jgi:hypothetical protein
MTCEGNAAMTVAHVIEHHPDGQRLIRKRRRSITERKTMTANKQTTSEAQSIISELKKKREQCVQRGVALQEARADIAFAAHAEDDTKSRARLKEINRECAEHVSELASLDTALKTAHERLDEVRRREAYNADQANAKELSDELRRFTEAGLRIDGALAILVEAGAALRHSLYRMHTLGVASPSHEQLSVLGTQALFTALEQTDWSKQFRRLAPNQRRTFASLVRGWHDQIMPSIARRLAGSDDIPTTR